MRVYTTILACGLLLWQLSLLYQISLLQSDQTRSYLILQPKEVIKESGPVFIPVLMNSESATPKVSFYPQHIPTPSSTPPAKKIEPVRNVYKNVHAFYYGWYGNIETNNQWMHWNHEILPDWRKKVKPPTFRFEPPEEIGANYYPLIGPYSSSDNHTIEIHAQQLAASGVGNAVVSWYPVDKSDEQLSSTPGYSDSLMRKTLEIFPKYGVQVSIHVEPYEGRNADTVRKDIEYIIDNYSGPGLYQDNKNQPIIYIYDSYHTPAKDWARLLTSEGDISIRNTKYDCTVITLYLDQSNDDLVLSGGFDGFYTYFGSVGFTYGSTPKNWKMLSKFAAQNGKIFIPSVSPGYIDTRIRPWNSVNTKDRKDGKYYDSMWEHAIECDVEYVSITSFNEWHEGSQIEPAKEFASKTFSYLDYSPHSPNYYLDKTQYWGNLLNSKNKI